ncbi:MAG: hypothetical protein HRU38_15710, partial [Saccharospirillaceae bacterium]|nr:hypothetical protein [Saccharospirillaceae bacterium]
MADYQIEYEAVFLFSSLKVVGQFTFEQFEKTIELREPREKLKGRTVKAAHLQLDRQLKLRTLVLFNLQFDDQGKVDEDWDIPLRHLAQMATKGPNLGDGSINISCLSQCSVDWYQQDLWEPDGSQTQSFFDALIRSINSNKLNFEILDKYEDEVLLEDMGDISVLDEQLTSVKSKTHKSTAQASSPQKLAPVLTSTIIEDEEKENLKKQIQV